MSSIFTKTASQIELTDVENLLRQGVRENECLDYKGDFPSNENIARLVTAFANTYGGVIIFGVSETDDGKPEAIVGVTGSEDDIDNKITSICMDRIVPPVIVETRFLKLPDVEKNVLIVKVFETDLCHAVDNVDVYVRVGTQKRPVDRAEFQKADLGRVSWLLQRRKKHVEFRDQLTKELEYRCAANLFPPDDSEIRIIATATPRFPREPIISYKQIFAHLSKVLNCLQVGGRRFYGIGERVQFPGGVGLRFAMQGRKNGRYVELNSHGCVGASFNAYAHPLDRREVDLHSIAVFCRIALFSCNTVLAALGFRGGLIYTIRILGLQSRPVRSLFHNNSQIHALSDCVFSSADPFLNKFPSDGILDDESIEDRVRHILELLLWSAGFSEDIEDMSKWFLNRTIEDKPILA